MNGRCYYEYSPLQLFAELLPHIAKRAVQQFVLGQVLRQYRATVGHVSVINDEIDALAVGGHGIGRDQIRGTENDKLVTALIEWALTQEGQHEIRIRGGAIESRVEHEQTIGHLAQILERLELIRHDIRSVPECLQGLLAGCLVRWIIQANKALQGVWIGHDIP